MLTEPGEDPFEATPEEERRARLQDECEIPEILVRALDRVPDAWSVLWVQRELHRLGDPADWRHFPTDPKDPLFRLHRLRARRAEAHLDYLESLELAFDFETWLLKTPTKGRPRTLYRSLVEALVSDMLEERPIPTKDEIRRRISSLLAPFFSVDRVAVGSKDLLARTIDNAVGSIRAKQKATRDLRGGHPPVLFVTKKYEEVHGRKPRGAGPWFFSWKGREGPFRIPKGTYLEAKRVVEEKARKSGATVVTVLP